jgi:predicted dehydrogenase
MLTCRIVLDSFINIVGDFDDVTARFQTMAPRIPVMNAKGEMINAGYKKTCPDHVFLHGILESGAIASIAQRHTGTSADGVGVHWIISGTEGEIEVTVPDTPLQAQWQFGDPGRALKLRIGTGEIQNVKFLDNGDVLEANVPFPGTNTARMYKEFAKGDSDVVPTFESAIKTHRLLDRIAKSAGWETF